MKPLSIACALALGLSLTAAIPVAQAQDSHATMSHSAAATTTTAPKLHAAMRALWQGHVEHTRAYAMAVKAGNAAGSDQGR